MNSSEFLTFLAAMLAIMNPIGGMPVFISVTADRSPEERRRIALVASLAVLVVLVVTALAGQPILRFFGISVASFRVAGGIIVLLIALSMLQARHSDVRHSADEVADGAAKDSPAVFPLAIPMISGPGAISTVIIYAHQAQGPAGWAAIAAVLLVMVLATYVAMRVAVPVAAALGTSGMNVAVRLMGILLAAIAVEMIAGGIVGLFPALGSVH
jgi:multiple antibiotic resistance protein